MFPGREGRQASFENLSVQERTLDRLAETVRDGTAAARRLSPKGWGRLRRCWPEALQRVVDIGTAHPEAQRAFLNTWSRVGGAGVREWTRDDDLFFKAMRILLPPYTGPDMDLFRGQVAGEMIGLSWSRSPSVAIKFALFGIDNVDPNRLYTAFKVGLTPRADGVLLRADVDAARILCAPCLLGHQEGEFIVDVRGLEFSITPIGRQVEERRR